LLYVDSNIFIYPIIYDQTVIGEAESSREFLLEIAKGKIEAYTSTLTWDEVAWILRKLLGISISINHGKRFLSFPNLRLLPVKRTTVLKAQEITERYKLKPRDALHAAVALENRIDTIVSYDRDFDELEEIRRIEPVSKDSAMP